MKKRIISGIVAIIVAIIATVNYFTPLVETAALFIYAVAVYEIFRVFKDGNSKFIAVILVGAGAATLFNVYIPISNMLIGVIFTILCISAIVFEFERIKIASVASTVAMCMYVLFGINSIIRIKILMPFESFGWDAAFMFVLCAGIAWGGDMMAYFSGYLFGKHKMSPVLSPKKTVEGAVGGILGSVVIALVMVFVYKNMGEISQMSVIANMKSHYLTLAVLSGIGSFVGIIGDLFASAVKRQNNIKDYGNIMPGHGGVMDRFDSFILVAPIISLLADFIVKL